MELESNQPTSSPKPIKKALKLSPRDSSAIYFPHLRSPREATASLKKETLHLRNKEQIGKVLSPMSELKVGASALKEPLPTTPPKPRKAEKTHSKEKDSSRYSRSKSFRKKKDKSANQDLHLLVDENAYRKSRRGEASRDSFVKATSGE